MDEVQRREATRAEEFLVAYNTIDRELRSRLELGRNNSFRSLVDRYASSHPWWRQDAEALRAFAELRNVIVHERFDRFRYISVPALEVVEEISAIRDRLLSPKLVHHVAGREVVTVQEDTPLTQLLLVVREQQINQLPVYGRGKFRGLVTSKGVLAWLAQNVEMNGSTVNLDEVRVSDLLKLEGARHNWDFVARDVPVDEAAFRFVKNPQLEALLVTEHGKKDQGLIGIMTQRDTTGLFD